MAFKKKPEEPKKGIPEYMGTYGDMITLMLCFFVMLFAMSNLDLQKFTAVAESFTGRPMVISGNLGNIIGDNSIGLMPEYDSKKPTEDIDEEGDKTAAGKEKEKLEKLTEMASDFRTYLSQNTVTENLVVEQLGDSVKITFPDGMLFDPGEATLKPDTIEALQVFADVLLTLYPDSRVRVEGHTDSVPMNTPMFPSNRHLSSARAATVVEYLVNEKGLNPLLISAEGMSEHFPIDTNDTAEGRAANRRVEIKVYGPDEYTPAFNIPMD